VSERSAGATSTSPSSPLPCSSFGPHPLTQGSQTSPLRARYLAPSTHL
jgi:hypothetical protein